MIDELIIFYFLVNVFYAGTIYEYSKHEYKFWFLILMSIFYVLLAIPILIINLIIDVSSSSYWKIYNFLYFE